MAQVRVNPIEGNHTATIVEVVVQPNDSAQLRNILIEQLPEMLRLFIKKNGEYGAGDASSGTMLGQRGQFADIWRKIGKLKTGIWDGNEGQLVTESVDEILRDLIGHCFLTLTMRQQEREAEYDENFGIFTRIEDVLDSLPSNQSVRDANRGHVNDVVAWMRKNGFDVKRTEDYEKLFGPDA